MLYELLKGGYAKGKDLSCTEQILYGANEVYDLGLDKNGLLLSAAFGGGMGSGDKCGAIPGALMVLGRMFVEDRAHESGKIKSKGYGRIP
jgi:C_GCAxxG_C_C family probable redox protein